MNKIVLDAEMRAKLGGGTAKVTLTDESGKPVGHYLPDDLYRAICDALVPPSEEDRTEGAEELQRGEVVTTAELLSGLRESLQRWSGQP
jgi:hypothetical protein